VIGVIKKNKYNPFDYLKLVLSMLPVILSMSSQAAEPITKTPQANSAATQPTNTNPSTPTPSTVIDPDGNPIVFNAPKILAKKTALALAQEPSFRILPEAGPSTLNYSETGITAYSEVVIRLKVGATYTLTPKKLSVYGSYVYDGLGQLSSAPTTSVSVTWVNLGAEYILNLSSMQIAFQGGWSSGNMTVTNNSFGFTGLSGFNINPIVTKPFGPIHTFGAHFKFAITQGTNSLGLIWQRNMVNKKVLQVNADLNFMNLTLQGSKVSLGGIGATVSYTGISFGI
jgi:hypothetical protein